MYDSTKRKTQSTIDKSKVTTIATVALLMVSLLVISSLMGGMNQSRVFALEKSYESTVMDERAHVINEKTNSTYSGPSNSSAEEDNPVQRSSNSTATGISRESSPSETHATPPAITSTLTTGRGHTTTGPSSPMDRETTTSGSIGTPTSSVATPSTISQDGSDFTIQAALSSLTARPTNNIVNTNSFYDIVFLTATSGAIKKIEVTFPPGTTIPSGAFFNEAEGIGPGTASKSGRTITYTVTDAVNVPAGTKIRLEFANINNPLASSASYAVTVTTRDAADAIIDGPSESTAYTIKQIGTNAIADSAITNSKVANSAITTGKIADNAITTFKVSTGFMKHVNLADDVSGNARGWNPNGATTAFIIQDPDIDNANFDFVILELNDVGASATNAICGVTDISINGNFDMDCNIAPANGIELHYILATVQPDT